MNSMLLSILYKRKQIDIYIRRINIQHTKRGRGDLIMNILLIGNGFDLAHGLPTKYKDFLEWVKAEYGLYCDLKEQDTNITQKANNIRVDWAIKACQSKIKVERLTSQEKQLELWKCISKNTWIDYFLNHEMYKKKNWIDFEHEIEVIIKSLEKDKENRDINDQIEFLSNTFLKEKFLYMGVDALFPNENGKRGGKQEISYSYLRDKLSEDLERLIRALEIYLVEYVEKKEIKVVSPDIQNVISGCDKKHRCKILNFNYTNTYERTYMYGINFLISDIDYIHGKADIDNSIENNNMVLGIDEYLLDDRKDKETEFIAFKKYYQRIYKGTGCKYKEWVD